MIRGGRNPASLTGPDSFIADLTTESGSASIVAAAVDAAGRLDGVVIAAGVVAFGPATEVSDAALDELFEINADIGRLDECLQALDAPKRNSILAAYLDGCSHSEIAERLNAPLGSVKAWIKRGLLSLRECMA